MTNIINNGGLWTLPNYAADLYSVEPAQTPLLSMIGGLNGGMQTNSVQFPTAVLFDYPAAVQPAISESASMIAGDGTVDSRSQESNVVQIHQEIINLTYALQSNANKITSIVDTVGAKNFADERAYQVHHKLIKIARDVEHSFINGSYNLSTSSTEANQTRGLLELCSEGTTYDAEGATLTKTMLDDLFRQMADNGAYFNNMVMFVPAYQKQLLSDIYGSQFVATAVNTPSMRNIGGVNITEIETDFCKIGICWSRYMPTDTILIADVAHIAPVFQAVPNKGVLFEEELAKTGAADKIQIYGQIGLAHGPAFLHGTITGLSDGTEVVEDDVE